MRRARRGSALVEMVFVCVQLFLALFATFEFARMIVVYTTLSNAARIGLRYAMVHGSTNTGSGGSGPSGPGATTEIENVIKNYAGVGLLDTTKLDITITYQDDSNAPGVWVDVRLAYAYDPFVALPLNVNLGAGTRGVIVF